MVGATAMRGRRNGQPPVNGFISKYYEAFASTQFRSSLLDFAQSIERSEDAMKATEVVAVVFFTTFAIGLIFICSVLWRQTSSQTPPSTSDSQATRSKVNTFETETSGPPQGELSVTEDDHPAESGEPTTTSLGSPRGSFAGFQEDEAASEDASRRWVDFQTNFVESEDSSDGEFEGRIFPKWSQQEGRKVAGECFEHDWEFVSLKLELGTEGEDGQVRALVKKCYVPVLCIYRRLSTQNVRVTSLQPGHSCFGVSLRVAMTFLGPARSNGIAFLNETTFSKIKAENVYKAALRRYVGDSADQVKPLLVHHDTGLVRHQFTEFLIRVARTRFPKDTYLNAVDKMLEAVSQLATKYNSDIQGLFQIGSKKGVASVFEKHNMLLASIFLKYAGQQVTMTIEQWSKLLMAVEIYSMYPGFKHDYTAYAFRLGVSTAADEQYCSDFQHMTFSEFKRGLCGVMFLSEYRTVQRCTVERLAEILEQWFMRDLTPLASKEVAPRKAQLLQLGQGKAAMVGQTKRRVDGNVNVLRWQSAVAGSSSREASPTRPASPTGAPPHVQGSGPSSTRSSRSTSPGGPKKLHDGSRSNSGPSTSSSSNWGKPENAPGSVDKGLPQGAPRSDGKPSISAKSSNTAPKVRREPPK